MPTIFRRLYSIGLWIGSIGVDLGLHSLPGAIAGDHRSPLRTMMPLGTPSSASRHVCGRQVAAPTQILPVGAVCGRPQYSGHTQYVCFANTAFGRPPSCRYVLCVPTVNYSGPIRKPLSVSRYVCWAHIAAPSIIHLTLQEKLNEAKEVRQCVNHTANRLGTIIV